MSSKSFNRTIALFFLIVAAFWQQSCGGGDCAANATVLTDYDSDCVPDESDNCTLAENPAGGYNPEQFDGDEDGIGFPCDQDDSDAGSAGVALIDGPAFNMAGSYRFAGDCPDFNVASAAQNQEHVQLTDETGHTYEGEAFLEDGGVTMTATLQGENGVTCVFTADSTTLEAGIACSKNAELLCRSEGLKIETSLWSDLGHDEPLL